MQPSNPGTEDFVPLPQSEAATLLPEPLLNADTPPPSPMASADVTAPRHFGDYELLEEIARGGMGVVYRAKQMSLGRLVALKMILAGQLATPGDVQRFHAEAEAAGTLDHPHIVPIYEVGEHQGQHYFAMKFIDGGSLTTERIKTGGPRQAAQILAVVARAVHHAHQRGILHRDIKPGNILLDAAGQPHVTDFGLAKRVEGDGGITQTGQIMGTPSYMPPEQARAEKRLTTAADVYSLGAVLYEMLTGKPPFRAANQLDTLLQVLEQDPPHPSSLVPQMDRDLETICLRCLEKDPAKRYGSAEALAEELERWLRGEPILARPTGTFERVRKWVRRNRVAAGLGVASILLVLALISAGILSFTVARIAQERDAAETARAEAQTAEQAARQARTEEAAARQLAVVRQSQAETAEAKETAARQLAEARQVQILLQSGQRRVDEDDLLQALPWFAEALRVSKGNKELEAVQRLRLAALLQACPRLTLLGHTPPGEAGLSETTSRYAVVKSGDAKSPTHQVWDLAAHRIIFSPLPESSSGKAVCFTHDESRFAYAEQVSGNWQLTFRSTTTGEVAGTPIKLPYAPGAFVIRHDDTRVVTVSAQPNAQKKYEVRQWELSTGKPLGEIGLLDHAGVGGYLPGEDKLLMVMFTGSREEDMGIEERAYPEERLGFGSFNRTLPVIDILTFTPEGRLYGASRSIFIGEFHGMSEDGRFALCRLQNPKVVRLLDVRTGRYVPTTLSPAIADQSRIVASNPVDGGLLVADSEAITTLDRTGRELKRFPRQAQPGSQLTFQPDTRVALIVEQQQKQVGSKLARGRLWNWRDQKPLTCLISVPSTGTTSSSPGVVSFPKKGEFATKWAEIDQGRQLRTIHLNGNNSEVRVWDWLRREPQRTIPLGGNNNDGFWLHKEGRHALVLTKPTRGGKRSARLYDVARNQPVSPELTWADELSPKTGILFSPDGGWMLAVTPPAEGQRNAPIRLRVGNLTTGQPVGPAWEIGNHLLMAPALSPDGQWVVTQKMGKKADAGDLTVWDARTGKPLRTLTMDRPKDGPKPKDEDERLPNRAALLLDDKTGLKEVVISPEGRTILALDATNLYSWDAATGQHLPTRPLPEAVSNTASGGFSGDNPLEVLYDWQVCFSPDGQQMAIFAEKTPVVYGPVRGPLTTLSSQLMGWAGEVVFSPDGRRLAILGTNGLAYVWDTTTRTFLTTPLNYSTSPYNVAHLFVEMFFGNSQNIFDNMFQAVGSNVYGRAAFSKDGRFLAVVAKVDGKQVGHVWEIATSMPVGPPALFTYRPTYIEFAPGDRQRISGPVEHDWWPEVWFLGAEERSNEDLIRHARLLSGQVIDTTGTPVAVDAVTLRGDWQYLSSKYPSWFTLSRAEVLAWHKQELKECEKNKDYWAMLQHLAPLLRAEPKNADLHRARGLAYSHSVLADKEQLAEAAYSQAVKHDPKNAMLWHHRGLVRRNLGQTVEAIADFTESLKLKPDNPQVLCDRAACYRSLKQWQTAEADSTEAIRLDPKPWKPWQDRAIARHALGRLPEATTDLRQALVREVPDEDTCSAGWAQEAAIAWLSEGISANRWGPDKEYSRRLNDLQALLIRRCGYYVRRQEWDKAHADGEEVIRLQRNIYLKEYSLEQLNGDAWRIWGTAYLHNEPRAVAAYHTLLLPSSNKYQQMSPYREALLRLSVGDLGGYRSLCNLLLELEEEQKQERKRREYRDDDHQSLYRITGRKGSLWLYALSAECPTTDWQELVRRGAKGDTLSLLGALQYRAGQYDKAHADLLKAVVDHPAGGSGWDFLFLALTELRRGQPAAAADWLAKADERLAVLEREKEASLKPKDPEKKLSLFSDGIPVAPWWEYVEMQLLRREVEAEMRKLTVSKP
jgi:tetratricopeptide (TPR) repeat protein/WD40 repeat protein